MHVGSRERNGHQHQGAAVIQLVVEVAGAAGGMGDGAARSTETVGMHSYAR